MNVVSRFTATIISGCVLTACLFLVQSETAHAQSSFKMGNFTKIQDAAPVTQVVTHNLGDTPKALIIWTGGGWTVDFNLAMGFSDGTTSKSVAAASRDKRSTAQANSIRSDKAVSVVEWDGSVLAESDLVSWDATTFTLNWTTNNGVALSMHYIMIGGDDISAAVIEWPMPGSVGSIAINTLGFEPDVVLHAYARESAATADGVFGLGVMDGSGSQWATSFHSVDGGSTSNTQRSQTTEACIQAIDATPAVQREGSFLAMTPGGFAVTFSTAPGWTNQVVSLALRGVSANAGSFSKDVNTTVPVSQQITGQGFQPGLLLLTSIQDVAQANPVSHTRFGFGATDGTTEGASIVSDEDGMTLSEVHSVDKSSKAFVVSDNVDGFVDAEADLTSLDADGFTLSWTTNNAVATEVLYLALGPIGTLSVSVDNSSFAFGVSQVNQWLSPDTSLIINDGVVTENFVGQISQFSDGSNSWNVSAVANGADSIRAQWSTTSSSGPWTDISAYAVDFTIATNVAVGDTIPLYFRIQTPSSTSSFNEHASTLTVTAQEF